MMQFKIPLACTENTYLSHSLKPTHTVTALFFNAFKKISDVMVANRLSDDIRDAEDKVYTRDIFESDS